MNLKESRRTPLNAPKTKGVLQRPEDLIFATPPLSYLGLDDPILIALIQPTREDPFKNTLV